MKGWKIDHSVFHKLITDFLVSGYETLYGGLRARPGYTGSSRVVQGVVGDCRITIGWASESVGCIGL